MWDSFSFFYRYLYGQKYQHTHMSICKVLNILERMKYKCTGVCVGKGVSICIRVFVISKSLSVCGSFDQYASV